MAEIVNIDRTIQIVFSFNHVAGEEWMKYSVDVFSTSNADSAAAISELLSLPSEMGLSLDVYYDPELPVLIDGIKDVANGRRDFFSFMPVDEREFLLEIKKSEAPHKFIVEYFVDKAYNNVLLGLKIFVDKDGIEKFVSQLIEIHKKSSSVR